MADPVVHLAHDDAADRPSREELLGVAERIAAEIATEAVWHGDRCNWIGALPEEGLGGRLAQSYRALSADLYGGSAGVGLFLAEVARASGEPRLRRTALAALRHAASRRESLAAPQVGLYGGAPGVVLALALAARALELDELDEAARALASTLPAPGPADELDLMSGSAGAIVALLALRELLGEDRVPLELAVQHGQALLDAAEPEGEALCWPARMLPDQPRLTGLSHGAAGIAMALLELGASTGEERWRLAADAGFAYERELFDAAVGNWPDLRGQGAIGPSFGVFWCHGAPGGALARARALELGGEAALRGEAEAGLRTTATWVQAVLSAGPTDFSLCHGLAGNVEVLLECGPLSPLEEASVARAAWIGLREHHASARPWPCGAQGGQTPCLFLGTAGIGRFYLRLAQPELPSLLVVRPERIAQAYADPLA